MDMQVSVPFTKMIFKAIIDELVKVGGNVNVFNTNRITPLHSGNLECFLFIFV